MSDEQEPKSGKGFFKQTWVQIVSGIIGLVILGAVGYVGASFKKSLDQLEEVESRLTKVETIQSTDMIHQIEAVNKQLGDFKESLKSNSSEMGAMGSDMKKLEILVNRLDAIVERIEKRIK